MGRNRPRHRRFGCSTGRVDARPGMLFRKITPCFRHYGWNRAENCGCIHPAGWMRIETRSRCHVSRGQTSCIHPAGWMRIETCRRGGPSASPARCIHPAGWMRIETGRRLAVAIGRCRCIHPAGWMRIETVLESRSLTFLQEVASALRSGCNLKHSVARRPSDTIRSVRIRGAYRQCVSPGCSGNPASCLGFCL